MTMAWPTQATTLNDALASVDRAARQLKERSAAFRAQAAEMNIAADRITEEVLRHLVVARDTFAAASALPGIAAYVASQRGVTQQAVTTAFSDMAGAVNSAIGWVVANLPKDAGGYLLLRQIDSAGAMTYRTFTPAQTAGLRAALTAVEATIS
ncbi:MAG: hypothetical protein WC869_12005 [Phycisphaerae bacterium]|jgi:hypothetical protein